MSLSWEIAVNSIQSATIFDRTISITRPPVDTTITPGYQGLTKVSETSIVTGLPATVQIAASGRNSASGGLPGDSAGPLKWTIILPASALVALPIIMERDFIYDDLGRRFQVSGYEPEAIGARIDCVRVLT